MTETTPEGFTLERGTGEAVIKWEALEQQKRTTGKLTVLFAVALLVLYAMGAGLALRILAGGVFLTYLYQFLVCHVNRTTIRAREDQWTFRRGPLPTLDPNFHWIRSVRSVNPTMYGRICSSPIIEERGSRGRWHYTGYRGLAALAASVAIDLALRHHLRTTSSKITYDLWLETRRGGRVNLLSRLTGVQAEYLVKVLQPFLSGVEAAPEGADATEGGLWWLDGTRKRSPAREAKAAPRAAAAPIPAASTENCAAGSGVPRARESRAFCPTCSASNPADSDFCGECGAPMGPSPEGGGSKRHDRGAS